MAARFSKALTNLNIPQGSIGKGVGILTGLGLLMFGAYNSFYEVKSGFRAIKFNRFLGVREKTYDEGMHFMIPYIERPIIYERRMRPYLVASRTGSKDLQMVDITLRTLFRPDPENLPTIYRLLGNRDYGERILESIGNEVLKSVVAQFNAAQLITKRELVSQLIRKRLTERAADFNIDLDDVSITHLSFGKEYSQAIERKQVAQQEAERARFIVEEARQKKLEIIAKAEGEAVAARKFNHQLQVDPEGNFLAFKRIEAAIDIARVLSGSQNKIYLNADNLLFNLLTTAMDKKTLQHLKNAENATTALAK